MIENLWIAAQISFIGMSLVFGAIVLLWGVLGLLVRLTSERQAETTSILADTAPATDASAPTNRKATLARAAAVAVATALALHKGQPPTAPLHTILSKSDVSAWQAVMRATALNARRPRR